MKTTYPDAVNERYHAIMAAHARRLDAIDDDAMRADELAQRHLDALAETWDELVAAGISKHDADRILGIFAL